MKPKVSVIIPIYNTQKYLQRCVDSVLSQSLKELEVILVDDESPDEAPRLCDEYAQRDSRIQVIHKENGGLGFARNSGLALATGEYVAFLDSDDYVEADFYERLYQTAIEAGADTCIAGYQLALNDGRRINHPNPYAGQCFAQDEVRQVVLPYVLGAPPKAANDVVMGMAVWKNLFSLALIRTHGLQFCSERQFISEDAIFDIDYFTHAEKVVISEACGYYYCENGASLSRTYHPSRFVRYEVLYQEELRRIKARGFGEHKALIQCIQRSFIGNARYCMQQIYHHLDRVSAIGEMKEICDNATLQEVLKQYPYQHNPFSLRLFNRLMQGKRGKWLWLLIALKN